MSVRASAAVRVSLEEGTLLRRPTAPRGYETAVKPAQQPLRLSICSASAESGKAEVIKVKVQFLAQLLIVPILEGMSDLKQNA